MRLPLQLVRVAVGDPSFASVAERKGFTSAYFDIVRVDLPLPDFNGVPPRWVFAIQSKSISSDGDVTRDQVVADAYALINKVPATEPIVLISDDPEAHFGDEFSRLDRDVFCLDADDLPRTHDYRAPTPRLAPFALAVARKLKVHPILALTFSPYQRGKPVEGWRFFGRKKHIQDIARSNENLVIVGARRVGKTSLLREAARRLEQDGETVYYVDVQNCRTPREVVNEILHVVSPRDLAAATKHHDVLQESVISNLLRRLARLPGRTTVFLDELGNVMATLPEEDWSFTGLFRKYSSMGQLKFVISCFQEVFLKQKEFEGPWINFARTIRLNVFDRKEVEEFVSAPLEFWQMTPVQDKGKFVELITQKVGSHPFVLQYFCHALFEKMAETGRFDPLQHAHVLLNKDLYEWFGPAAYEIFFLMPSAAQQYLFLRRCRDAEEKAESLIQTDVDDDWVEKALAELGYDSTFQGRRNLLEGLEMHGLCTSLDADRSKKVVAAPLIYQYVKRTVPSLDNLLRKLSQDMRRETVLWDLLDRAPGE